MCCFGFPNMSPDILCDHTKLLGFPNIYSVILTLVYNLGRNNDIPFCCDAPFLSCISKTTSKAIYLPHMFYLSTRGFMHLWSTSAWPERIWPKPALLYTSRDHGLQEGGSWVTPLRIGLPSLWFWVCHQRPNHLG